MIVNPEMNRRAMIAGLGAAAGATFTPSAVLAHYEGPLGERLYADVERYSGLGHHRTGGPGDEATTSWLAERLSAAGYEVSSPRFELPTFEPAQCHVRSGDSLIDTFPAWPVVPTCGITRPLHNAADGGSLEGKIGLVILPYRPGSAFVVRGFGSTVLDAQSRGADAIVVVTEGPTGEIIALNAHLERYAWRVPVVLAAGKERGCLEELAARQAFATVEVQGEVRPRAHATNVLGRRAARKGAPEGAVVLTTPKSGWFTCAGERGSGIALFLEAAERLVRWTDRELLVVATTGHELEGLGGEKLLEQYAPPPGRVALWTHIGANIASNEVDLSRGVRRTDEIFSQRGILVPASLMKAAGRAFARQPGYATPVDILSDKAVGEVVIYRRDGYHRLIGMVGAHPLHHTVLDLPRNVTSPDALEPVALGLFKLLQIAVSS